jgi:hypothetical protein
MLLINTQIDVKTIEISAACIFYYSVGWDCVWRERVLEIANFAIF